MCRSHTVVALFSAFILSMVMAEYQSVADASTRATFDNLDLFLTVLFTVELMVNWSAEWCLKFFFTRRRGFQLWNCFDFVGGSSWCGVFAALTTPSSRCCCCCCSPSLPYLEQRCLDNFPLLPSPSCLFTSIPLYIQAPSSVYSRQPAPAKSLTFCLTILFIENVHGPLLVQLCWAQS